MLRQRRRKRRILLKPDYSANPRILAILGRLPAVLAPPKTHQKTAECAILPLASLAPVLKVASANEADGPQIAAPTLAVRGHS
jgi:hypothetical protein